MNIVQKYTKFRKEYEFNCEPLIKIDDKVYFRDYLVEDENKKYSLEETDDVLNIGYNYKYSLSRMLSNLYPISFKFRGKKVSSIEGVLQGIKHKDKKTQNLVLKYFGLDAYHTRGANTIDFWGKTQKLYWQGKEMDRNSEEYQAFIDELYISAVKNPLYRKALLQTEDRYLLHHFGNDDPMQTVLTRAEYEERLNTLKEFVEINIDKF